MKMKKYIHLILFLLAIGLFSCEKYLEPLQEGNRLVDEQMLENPSYFEGLLVKAYSALPNNYNNFDIDVASDDAVTNLKAAAITTMATGGWTSSTNPISVWISSYEQIRHLNLFLDKYESVNWSFDPRLTDAENTEKNGYHLQRLKGEAHGLRAYYMAKLLQFHGGKSATGELLGFPIITEPLGLTDDWKLPRNTFAQCVTQIMSDLDIAIANLPDAYKDVAGQTFYNAALGALMENRMNKNAARTLKSRVALLAASPAFSESSGVTWADAATIAGDLLRDMGALDPGGKTFYNYAVYTVPPRIKEVIWEQAVVLTRSAEINNFPPSLFGNARTNPTQSLVDAFPMANGQPISATGSGYDPANPYAGRDPRLNDYIIYNGSSFKSTTINTFTGAPLDGVNTQETSTRTGYYLKKFMNAGVNLTPGNLVSQSKTYILFRMTEVLLNYAEAANEAWGPTGDPNGYGFSAQSKIRELRARAGILPVADPYLYSLTDIPGLRELIKNERRIELCFEGFRFWDIRRWDNAAFNITKPATGVLIVKDELNALSYEYVTVEPRLYQPYMVYGPIPFNETLKYDITQNAGW
jgi:starch-binding outer membrane protein, SusD/RagB family